MLNVFTLYSLASMLLSCMVYQLILVVKARRNGQRCQAVHVIWIYIFLIYIWMVFQVTGIGRLGDILRTDTDLILGGVNFVPFDSIGIGYILNVVMCMPLGFLLPLIWEDCRKLGKTVMIGAGFSLLIEITQLFNYRATDIDDLTANTLGVLLGYFIWKIFVRLFGIRLKARGNHLYIAVGGRHFFTV